MKKIAFLLLCCSFSAQLWAYGSSSSSKKACTKPDFSDFTPAHLSEIPPGSDFSFTTTATTDSLTVTVKNQPVNVQIEAQDRNTKVSGKLPDNLSDTHARISLEGKTERGCKGQDGWLLKITH